MGGEYGMGDAYAAGGGGGGIKGVTSSG